MSDHSSTCVLQTCLSLVDLVELAWKRRMNHAKLGSKEARHLSRGRNRHKHIQAIGSLSAVTMVLMP